jgi:hypothetical protein
VGTVPIPLKEKASRVLSGRPDKANPAEWSAISAALEELQAALDSDDQKAFTKALDDLTVTFAGAIRGSKLPPPAGADRVPAVATPDRVNELIRKIEPNLPPSPSQREKRRGRLRRR